MPAFSHAGTLGGAETDGHLAVITMHSVNACFTQRPRGIENQVVGGIIDNQNVR